MFRTDTSKVARLLFPARRSATSFATAKDTADQWRRMRLDSAPVGIALCDASGVVLESNRALAELLGVAADTLASRSLTELVRPHFLPEGRTLESELTQARGQPYRVDRRWRRPDGSLRWVRMTASLTGSGAGDPGSILAVFEDISEQMNGREQVAALAAVIDMAPDAILIEDPEARICFWSKGAEELLGWTAAEMLGRRVLESLILDGREVGDEAEHTTLHSASWRGRLRLATRAGKEVAVDSRWSLVRDGGGNRTGILIVNTDLTARSVAEARLQGLGEAVAGIALALEDLLTPMLMVTKLLERSVHDERLARLITTLERGVHRGNELAVDLTRIARGASLAGPRGC